MFAARRTQQTRRFSIEFDGTLCSRVDSEQSFDI